MAAADPNPALRAELEAALAVLAPQLRGLHDLAETAVSSEVATALNEQIVDRQRRHDMIVKVLANLDQVVTDLNVLENDGYPALPPVAVPASLFEALQEEEADMVAAVSIFVEQASAMTVTLGTPQAKG